MRKKVSELGEFGLINLIQRGVYCSKEVIRGIGDDAAVLDFVKYRRDSYQLFTTDMMVEDVHFTRWMKPYLIGQKSLACNISDIAAMGGVPAAAVVSLGVPSDLEIRFVKEIYRGMNNLAKRFSVAIVGGDTVKSEKIVISMALLGWVKRNKFVTRTGARCGDMIFVTGPLGKSFETGKHLSFTPRISQAQFLVRHFKPTAMIDISDGLLADLGHILNRSQVGACLYEEKVPRTKNATLKEALSDGEDFELLFTLPQNDGRTLLQMKQKQFLFYHIGEVVESKNGLVLVNKDASKQIISPPGFTHF